MRYRGEGTTSVGWKGELLLHQLVLKISISCGMVGVRNGVGIFINFELARSVIVVERFGDRMMKVKMVLGRTVFHISSVYALQVGRSEEEKMEFWERFQDMVVGVPISEGVIVGGDVIGHIGSSRVRYDDVMGSFGLDNRNTEGGTVLDFCRNHQLRILNTYSKKAR